MQVFISDRDVETVLVGGSIGRGTGQYWKGAVLEGGQYWGGEVVLHFFLM